jgi:uncharacterized membrane protein (UPF0127 family)
VSAPLRLLTAQGTEVATRVTLARSMWSRFMGLMGRADLPEGEGLAITPCSQIHMFFMRFPIDVVYVDREGRVVFIHHSIRPWRVGRWVRGARTAVELPAGTLRRHRIERGQVLRLEEAPA